MDVAELVDLERYPLDDLGSPAALEVVSAARAQLAERGAAELPGFVHVAGVEALVADAERLAERGHRSGGLGGPYLGLPDESLPEDHPRRFLEPYAVSAVGYDVIPTSSPLRTLYDSELVLAFIEAVLDRGQLHRYADPCGALNLAVMDEGDALQWHFDQTDFVVSLAIQSSEGGGAFEVAPRIRSEEHERYDEVAAVLQGDRAAVQVLAMTPGTLLVFEGRHSLHRVSPVEGSRSRHVGLLAYDTKAGTVSSDFLREVRYGRVVPFDVPPERWPA